MSDFLSKFKSIFVADDPNAPAPKPAETSQPASNQPASTPLQSTTYVPPPPVPRAGVLTEKFMDVFGKALEANNQEGFDFLEFRSSLQSLSKMPMDEATRYKSAYAMAQTLGATPEKLVNSAKFYLDILKKEEAKFAEAAAQQRARLIGSREQEMTNLEAENNHRAAQIKQLTQEIDAANKRVEQIKHEISESTVKVQAANDDFHATYATVVGQITDDINRMNLYFK